MLERLRFLLLHRRFRAWLMLVGMLVALICFEEVADDVFDDPKLGDFEAQHLDTEISRYFGQMRSPRLNQVMVDLTALGSVSIIIVLYTIFVSILTTLRDWKGISFVSVVLMGAGFWPAFLKLQYQRGRPAQDAWLVNVADLSFPSGHAFGAAAAYLGFAYYASLHARTWSHELFFFVLGLALALMVGVSRIYLGVHYPTDVLAGLSGGIAWALFAAAVHELFVRKGR